MNNLQNNKSLHLHRFPNNQGYIRLIQHEHFPVPQIEYGVNDGCRYQGLMSKELPKYLKVCATQGFDILVALVKEKNIPSIKLLEKNGFVYIKTFGETLTYIWSAHHEKSQIKEFIAQTLTKIN